MHTGCVVTVAVQRYQVDNVPNYRSLRSLLIDVAGHPLPLAEALPPKYRTDGTQYTFDSDNMNLAFRIKSRPSVK